MLAGSFLQEPGLVLTCTSAVLLLLPLLHTVVYSGFGRDKHLFTLSIQQGLNHAMSHQDEQLLRNSTCALLQQHLCFAHAGAIIA